MTQIQIAPCTGTDDLVENLTDAMTVGQMCRLFLEFKQDRIASGELKARTYNEYRRLCDELCHVFGRSTIIDSIRPADFGMLRSHFSARVGPRATASYIRCIKTVFRWAWDAELIERPIRYGGMFDQPSRATVRRDRRGKIRQFTAAEINALLEAAEGQLKTFILLGINCGYGQTDCAELPAELIAEAIDSGVLTFERPKTAIERSAVLWPETIDALKASARSEGRAFLTRSGNAWVRSKIHRDANGDVEKATAIDAVSLEFRKLLDSAGVKRRGFYCLRRTFRTVADEVGDQHAAARVMGHTLPGMAGIYVQRIGEDRLATIANHVHKWLYGPGS